MTPPIMKSAYVPKGPSFFYFFKNRHALSDPTKILDVFSNIISTYGTVASFRSGIKERTYLVADAELSHKIFTSPKDFPKYPTLVADITKLQSLIGKGLLATHSDEEWHDHRKQMTSPFKPSNVLKYYYPVIIRHLNALVDGIRKQTAGADLNISDLAIVFSGRIISDILSPCHQLEDRELIQVKHVLDKGILEFHSRSFKKKAPVYKATMLTIAEKLLDAYLMNEAESQHGLIAKMIQSFPNIRHSSEERKSMLERLLNIIIAGYETTSTTIAWILYLLTKNSGIAEEIYDNIKNINIDNFENYETLENIAILDNAIKESMRLYPALWFNIRYCVSDIIVNNIKLKTGDKIMLLPYLSNKDNLAYTNPEEFSPKRFTDPHTIPIFPFGHGPRLCMGKALAEMEIKIFVSKFIQLFDFEAVNDPKPIGGVLMHPNEDIKLKLRLREPMASLGDQHAI